MSVFTIIRSFTGEFQFLLKAPNGQVIFTSVGYAEKDACLENIEYARQTSQSDENFNRLTYGNGNYYFQLTSARSEIIGTSEIFYNKDAMETSIISLRYLAFTASVIDLTE